MNDREKIIEILKQTSDIWAKEESCGYIVSVDFGKIADALIEAGIGDVHSLAKGNLITRCTPYAANFHIRIVREGKYEKY